MLAKEGEGDPLTSVELFKDGAHADVGGDAQGRARGGVSQQDC